MRNKKKRFDFEVVRTVLFKKSLGIKQLPVEILTEKLARTLSLIPNFPPLDVLEELRLELGGHSIAAGFPANNLWDEKKMDLWLKAIHRVCKVKSVQKNDFDNLDITLETLEKAWGRAIGVVDKNILDQLFISGDLSKESKSKIACLFTFSSLEFISK